MYRDIKEKIFVEGQFEIEREYWVNKLSGELEKTVFPADFINRDTADPAASNVETLDFKFPAPLSGRLLEIANNSSPRLRLLLVTGLSLLLYKYTGHTDIIIGTPIDKQEIEGDFINTVLPLRIRVNGSMTVKELVMQVKETVIEARKNQNYPIDTLPHELNIPGAAGKFPLFGIALLLENIQDRQYIRHIDLDMLFSFPGTGDVPGGTLEYNAALFERQTVERITNHFIHLMQGAFFNMDLKVGEIPLPTEEEKKVLVFEFNNTAVDYPGDKVIHRLFEEQVEQTPDRAAVLTGNNVPMTVTYRQLNQRANRLAHRLRSKGVKQNTIVGIMVERSIDLIAGLLGILKAGGAYLTMDKDYPGKRVRRILKDSCVKILIADGPLEDKPALTEIIGPDEKGMEIYESNNVENLSFPTDLVYIIYTSGSTGHPKGVLIRHRGLCNLTRARKKLLGENRDSRMSQVASPGFDAMAFEVWPCLLNGALLCIADDHTRMSPSEMKKWLIKFKITVSFQPTVMAMLLLKEEWADGIVSLQFLLTAGDKLTQYALPRLPFSLYNLYGPTEDTVWTTWSKVGVGSKRNSAPPIGKPVDNHEVYIVDSHLNLCPIRVPGEILILGQGLALGYLNNPEQTAEKFIRWKEDEQAYRTGDIGQWLPDGEIEFLGRIDQQVKIRGFRIELGEIENRLSNHHQVKEAVVTTGENENGTKYLCAYIVFKGENEKIPGDEALREYLALELPDYMIPVYFVSLEKIPLTASGKIDRKALPGPEIKSHGGYCAPRNRVEEKLVEIWASLLRIDKSKISVTDSFFELGGHSLIAAMMAARIHREFNVAVSLPEIFKNPRINYLSTFIEDAPETFFETISPIEKKEYYAQSSAQKRLFFLEKFEHIGTTYNMPTAVFVTEKLDEKKFKGAVIALMDRHETFRTSFDMIGTEAVQRVHGAVDFEIEKIDCSSGNVEEAVKAFIRPFNLSVPPLLRVGLGALPGDEFLLLFDMHHIISDGTSRGILMSDFGLLYKDEVPPPLNVQYKDFSHWQNRLFDSGEMEKQENYWMGIYADAHDIPRLDLPADFQRPPVFSFAGENYYFRLTGEETAKLRRVCLDNTITPFMYLLAVYNVLLFKYTGQETVVIGIDIAGRPHADLQPIIGMFINELAIRNHPGGNKPFNEFLDEIKVSSLAAFENQDYQFEELVDKLQIERDPSRNPLFDAQFGYLNAETTWTNLDSISGVPYHFEERTAKFDLALDASEGKNIIDFRFQYYSDLFRMDTVEAMAGHFLNILKEVMENPGIPLRDIAVIDEKEKHRLLFEFNNTKTDLVRDKCFTQLFEEQVKRSPRRTAVICRKDSLSYEELDSEANRLAHYLIRGKNIVPNDRVGIWMDRSVHFLVSILGIMKACAAYVPIDPSLPEERIKKIIVDAEIGVVISEEKFEYSLNRLQWECPSFHSFLLMDGENRYLIDKEEENDLKGTEELWNYVVETATDDITEGGWLTSYTGAPFSRLEMDEYGDNALKKVIPLLHENMRVLEIGCASGITMYRVAPRVRFYYGTDLSRVTIERNEQRIREGQFDNIGLQCVPAHEIDKIPEKDFDLVIINSVIQSFAGHNYLRFVLRKVIDLMSENSYLFLGDLMDQDLKENLIRDMIDFKNANYGKNYITKVDWSLELFISRSFLEDLTADSVDFPEIQTAEFSDKIYTVENELTKFRYDALLTVDKSNKNTLNGREKHKYQDGSSDLLPYESTVPEISAAPDDLAYVIYTSGTTGQPKGVLVHQLGMINHLFAKINDLAVTEDDIIAQTASVSFDISVWQFLAALLVGGKTFIIDKQTVLDPLELLKVLEQGKVTVFESVPSLMSVFLDVVGDKETENSLTHLRWMIPTGEALLPSLVKEWYLHYPGIKLVNAYGPTEASDDITHYVVDAPPPDSRVTIPIGKPLQNLHIYILDENLSLCPTRVRGEICVAGIGVGKGYWKDPEKTARSFIPNPFLHIVNDPDYAVLYRTGDIGYFTPDGTLECLGRMDNQVKINGNRIELEEIESRVLEHPGVKDAAVLCRDADDGEKYLCAYIVSDNENISQDLRESLSHVLPAYMIPSYFVNIDKMPVTLSGKIDKKALLMPELKAGEGYVAPRDETERRLVDLWSRILARDESHVSKLLESIGIDDDFFELGGNSLKATVMMSKIHNEIGVKMELAWIFQNGTVREIASLIETIRSAAESMNETDDDEEMLEVRI